MEQLATCLTPAAPPLLTAGISATSTNVNALIDADAAEKDKSAEPAVVAEEVRCLLYTSPSPRD
eukprot:15299866-Alexandrium_andersonii.AAC.1